MTENRSSAVDLPGRSKVLALILGANAWPGMPSLRESNSFALSASAFERYLTDEAGLNLPEGSVKSFFNSTLPRDQIDLEIQRFLELHHVEGIPSFSDLIVYYTGHGDFTRSDQHFQLMLPATNEKNSDFSGYQMRQLAATVNRAARKVRKLVILDCCYAAAAFGAWQTQNVGDVKDAIVREAADNFPDSPEMSGTALICACDEDHWALFKDDQLTMFTEGLMQSLRDGDVDRGDPLNIGDIYSLTRTAIVNRHRNEAVAPVLHVAKGKREAMLACAFFPNPARRAPPLVGRLVEVEAKMMRFGEQIDAQQTELKTIASSLAVIQNSFEEKANEVLSIKAGLDEKVKSIGLPMETLLASRFQLDVPEFIWKSCPNYVRAMYMRWGASKRNGLLLEVLSACSLVVALVPWGLALGDALPTIAQIVKPAVSISATFVLAYTALFGGGFMIGFLQPWRAALREPPSPSGPTEAWELFPPFIEAQSEAPFLLFHSWPVSRNALFVSGVVTLLAAIVSAYALSHAF